MQNTLQYKETLTNRVRVLGTHDVGKDLIRPHIHQDYLG